MSRPLFALLSIIITLLDDADRYAQDDHHDNIVDGDDNDGGDDDDDDDYDDDNDYMCTAVILQIQ